MKLGALLPHLGVYGGVRRYLEMGNVFTFMKHEYTLFVAEISELKWFNFIGKIKPLTEVRNEQLDVLFCGDVGLFKETKLANAKLKIIQTIGCRGIEKYIKFYDEVQNRSDFLFAGVSTGWNENFDFKNSITIPGGVNTNIFRPQQTEKKDEVFNVLTLGRVDKKIKCVQNIIKAIKMLKKKNIKLILYNDKPIKLGFKGIGIDIERVVGITQEGLAKLYNSADIYVSAESGAGWSNPCAEAMACRTAVICTKYGTRDFAVDGETALLLKDATPYEISNSIEVLYNDETLRGKIATAGYSLIQKFSWENVCKKFLDVICEKLGNLK